MRTADAVRSIEAGIVLSTPSLPEVWAVNQLRVAEALTFDELVDLAEHELAGFDYRQIAVEHRPPVRDSRRRSEPRAGRWSATW